MLEAKIPANPKKITNWEKNPTTSKINPPLKTNDTFPNVFASKNELTINIDSRLNPSKIKMLNFITTKIVS